MASILSRPEAAEELCPICQGLIIESCYIKCASCTYTMCNSCFSRYIEKQPSDEVFYFENNSTDTAIRCARCIKNLHIPSEVAVTLLKNDGLKRYLGTLKYLGSRIIKSMEEKKAKCIEEEQRYAFLGIDMRYKAVTCPECGYGPYPIEGCNDNMQHHGQLIRKPITFEYVLDKNYKPSRINNACIKCGLLTEWQDDMPQWDGVYQAKPDKIATPRTEYHWMFHEDYKLAVEYGEKKKAEDEAAAAEMAAWEAEEAEAAKAAAEAAAKAVAAATAGEEEASTSSRAKKREGKKKMKVTPEGDRTNTVIKSIQSIYNLSKEDATRIFQTLIEENGAKMTLHDILCLAADKVK